MNESKHCSVCDRVLPRPEFYKDGAAADRLKAACKDCVKLRSRRHRLANKKRDAFRSRRYYAAHKGKEAERHRRYRVTHITEIARYQNLHHAQNPEQNPAQQKLRYAVKIGRLSKGPCEVCGTTRVDGHHDDYSKPLDVRWLCRQHHIALHHLNTGDQPCLTISIAP